MWSGIFRLPLRSCSVTDLSSPMFRRRYLLRIDQLPRNALLKTKSSRSSSYTFSENALGQKIPDHVSVDIGEPSLDTVVVISESRVIEPQKV